MLLARTGYVCVVEFSHVGTQTHQGETMHVIRFTSRFVSVQWYSESREVGRGSVNNYPLMSRVTYH